MSKDAIARRAKSERWDKARATARDKAETKSIQKVAAAAADVATVAARVKKRLLLRLERTEAAFPTDATEAQLTKDGKRIIYRLRDLTAAYKDLTGDVNTSGEATNELLQSLLDLERGRE